MVSHVLLVQRLPLSLLQRLQLQQLLLLLHIHWPLRWLRQRRLLLLGGAGLCHIGGQHRRGARTSCRRLGLRRRCHRQGVCCRAQAGGVAAAPKQQRRGGCRQPICGKRRQGGTTIAAAAAAAIRPAADEPVQLASDGVVVIVVVDIAVGVTITQMLLLLLLLLLQRIGSSRWRGSGLVPPPTPPLAPGLDTTAAPAAIVEKVGKAQALLPRLRPSTACRCCCGSDRICLHWRWRRRRSWVQGQARFLPQAPEGGLHAPTLTPVATAGVGVG